MGVGLMWPIGRLEECKAEVNSVNGSSALYIVWELCFSSPLVPFCVFVAFNLSLAGAPSLVSVLFC